MSEIGNLARAGSVPQLPTRTKLPVALSMNHRSAVLLHRQSGRKSRNPRQRLKPFLTQGFRRSQEVIHDVTGNGSALYGGFSIQEGSSVGNTGGSFSKSSTLKRDDKMLRELALLRKKYNTLKKNYKHSKAAIDNLEFTNRNQARVLQQQQNMMFRQEERDIKVTRVLAALPKEEFLISTPTSLCQ